MRRITTAAEIAIADPDLSYEMPAVGRMPPPTTAPPVGSLADLEARIAHVLELLDRVRDAGTEVRAARNILRAGVQS